MASEPIHGRPVEDGAAGSIARLTRLLREAELDCACRDTLFRAIETFRQLESRRRERRALDTAFARRREILGLLVFLDDLERIVDPAFDASVCAEVARVFEDIAAAATQGAASLHRLAEAEAG